VNRGGSWNNNPQNCRAANRNNWNPTNRNNNVGFRLARSLRLCRMATDKQAFCPVPQGQKGDLVRSSEAAVPVAHGWRRLRRFAFACLRLTGRVHFRIARPLNASG